jgi:two-component system, OmpR family, sensor histidine kinase QseC
MSSRNRSSSRAGFPRAAFHRRLALIFGAQLVAMLTVGLLGFYELIPPLAALILIVVVGVLAWLAARRQWRAVRALARVVRDWDKQRPDLASLHPPQLPARPDPDVAVLARGLHDLASRIAGYNQRERNFTRDASHELRSPLTVIKMSTDMLADEAGLSEFGQRSLRRIKRATRELEAVVEALLILARESDNGPGVHDFVVNEVLRHELEDAREVLHGRLTTLRLEEQACFSLHGSPRVFAVLCGQLIRHASQYAGQGTVVVTVLPGAVTVSARADAAGAHEAPPQGFELAIAQRISERFAWPLDLRTDNDGRQTARIRFPQSHPVSADMPSGSSRPG